jgi:hypothetical protein
MKREQFGSAIVALIVLTSFLAPAVSHSQEAMLQVASAVFCKKVEGLAAVDEGSSFPASVGRLFCLTHIENIQDATDIFHVWHYGDIERARVRLRVNSPSWRTYSSKIIQSHETGAWRVDILDGSANLLKSVQFEITP